MIVRNGGRPVLLPSLAPVATTRPVPTVWLIADIVNHVPSALRRARLGRRPCRAESAASAGSGQPRPGDRRRASVPPSTAPSAGRYPDLSWYIARSAAASTSSSLAVPWSRTVKPTLMDRCTWRCVPRSKLTSVTIRRRSFGDGHRLLGASVRQDHSELVTTKPGDGVGPAQPVSQGRGYRLERPVSNTVAIVVVDLFEIIDVDHH